MYGRVFFLLLAVAFASQSPALDGAKYLIVVPDSFVDAARRAHMGPHEFHRLIFPPAAGLVRRLHDLREISNGRIGNV